MKSWFLNFIMKIMGVVSSTPIKSGKAMAGLIFDPELEHISGKYFQISKEIDSSKESYNQNKALELWETSIVLTKLKQSEQLI